MAGPQGQYVMGKKPGAKRQLLYDFTYMRLSRVVKFIHRRIVVARAWKEGGHGELFNGYEFQFSKMKKF